MGVERDRRECILLSLPGKNLEGSDSVLRRGSDRVLRRLSVRKVSSNEEMKGVDGREYGEREREVFKELSSESGDPPRDGREE